MAGKQSSGRSVGEIVVIDDAPAVQRYSSLLHRWRTRPALIHRRKNPLASRDPQLAEPTLEIWTDLMIDDQDDRYEADPRAAGDDLGRSDRAAPPSKEPIRDAESPKDKFTRQAQERRLGKGDDDVEEQLWEGGYSPKAMMGTWLVCVLLTIAAIVVTVMFPEVPWLATVVAVVLLWVIVAGVYAARRFGVHYQLTTQRFIHQTGVLSRHTDRIEVIDIDDVSYQQGPVQRMLGIGSIRIDSSDRSHPVLTMRGIDSVHNVAGLIDDIRRKERRRRSLHIESV